MKKLDFLSDLLRRRFAISGMRAEAVNPDSQPTVSRRSTLTSVQRHPESSTRSARERLKYVAMLVMLFTISIGNVWGGKITLTASSLGLNGTYYTNKEVTVDGVTFVHSNLMKNSSNIQAKASSGVIYNKTAMPGNITEIKVTHSGTARSTTVYYGTSSQPTTNETTFSGSKTISVSGSNKYFKITRGSNAAYWTSIEITYADAVAYTITATRNNDSYGTVSVTGTTITATPAAGYRVMAGNDGYTVTSGTATVVNNGDNTFTVTPSSNCTVRINFESKGCTNHGASSITGGALSDADHGPVHAYYDYSTSQFLYTKSDLDLAAGKKGTIKSIYFEYSGAAAMAARTIKIYMANTDLSSLTTSNYVPYASFTQVYSGTFSCGSAGWYEITLDTPFDYNGAGQLAVMIDDNTNTYESSKSFKYHSATGKQIYKRQDDTDIDPASWTPASAIDYRPNTKFCIQEADMVQYTVNWYVNGSLAHSQTGYPGTTLTGIPTPDESDCDGSKVFVGWYTSPYSHATDAPDFVSPTTIPNGGANYYAVFATAAESSTKFKRMADLSELNSASKIAFINSYSSSRYILNTSLGAAATTPTESDGEITVSDGQYWTLESSNSNWKFKTGTDYLVASTIPTSSSKSGAVSKAASGNTEWVITSNSYTSNGTPVFTVYSAASSTAGLEYSSGWLVYYGTDFNTSWYTIRIYVPKKTYSAYVTTCCTPLGTINGSVNFTNPTKAVLVWDAVAHVDGWTAKWKTGAGSYATTNVSAVRDTLTNKKTCVVTGLSCNTAYNFKIIATPASGYCDKEQEITNQNSGQWDVTYSLSNASRSSGQTAGTDALCGDLDVVFAATSGYILPNSVIVTGASSHTWNQATGALHVDAANITGDITVSFTATAATGWKFKSEADDWTEHAMTENAGVATCSVSLDADSRIEFCFDGNGTAYKNNGTIITTTSGWTFYTDHNNCHIHTGPAGTYTFAINTSTHAVTVTYPTVSHPNEHYVYFKNSDVWGTVKGYLSNSGNDNKAAAWPGSDMQATASICGETYHYAALNAMNGTYNTIIFNNGNSGYGNQTSDLSTTGSLGKYNANRDANWHDFTLYTISFAGNGSDGGSMTDVENICPNGSETLAANGYTRTGYTFANWKTNVAITANGSPVAANGDVPAGATISSINSNIMLTAQWTANTISLTLNKNTEDAGSNNGSGSIDFDATSGTISTAPTRTGYSVEGYYTDAACTAANKVLDASGNVINSTVSGYTTSGKWTRATTPTTLYAKWTPTNYTVDWYVGGSAEGNKLTTGSQSTSVAYGSRVTTLPSTPDGSSCEKTFVGWTNTTSYSHGTSVLFTDAAGSPTITGNTQFYAVFAETSGSANTFTLVTDASSLSDGDEILIVSPAGTVRASQIDYDYGAQALSTTVAGSTRLGGTDVTISENTITTTTATIFTLAGNSSDGWKIHTGADYLYGTAKNGMSTTTTVGDALVFPISIAGSDPYKATIGDVTLGPDECHIDFNPSVSAGVVNKYFALYAGNQKGVYIYKKSISYTNHTIVCASCSNEVQVAYDADPTGGTVAVSKGGTPVAENGTLKTCTGSVALTITVTPSSHYSVSAVTFTPSDGLTAGDLSGTSTPASTTDGVWTYNVTIAQDADGTLTITPTLTEDVHKVITWTVHGGSASIADGHGTTWVYSGENLTAIPDAPDAPTGCDDKVFVGWSENDGGATEGDASDYTDLFTNLGGAPTGITTDKTFTAVFATPAAGLGGTVMWDEPWTGESDDATPSSQSASATVYNSTTLTYAYSASTRVKTDGPHAGGTSPELLIKESGGNFTASNIPTASQTSLTLTYKSNKSLTVSTNTSGVTVGDADVDGSTYTRTITIDQSGLGVANLDLVFTKTGKNNARLDDIHLVVPGSSSMSGYVTTCEDTWTVTYYKNTEDAVTNLPSPTGISKSTGSGTLSSKVPVRYGYTFDGWAISAGGSVAYAAGAAVSSVSADMDLYAKWSVTPVTEINLSKTSLDKYVGDPSVILSVLSVLPDGANTSVTWSSSNPSVATVNSTTGEVNFVAVGTANIIATSTITSGTTATCAVTVWAKPTVSFLDNLHSLTEDKDGNALSGYNLTDVAGTPVVFPVLANQPAGSGTCEDEFYVFIGWTTSDNNTDPEDHLVTSHNLTNGDNITYYAVWANGVSGTTYTKLTSSTFKTSPTKYVLGAEYNGTTKYFYSCEKTDKNNSWGYVTADLASNTPIEFTLSGTAAALVATSTEVSARYLKPLTEKDFQMSASSQTVELKSDGTIYNPSTDWKLLYNNANSLRWYDSPISGSANAYFYEVVAGGEVNYRTSCCADKVAAPTVTATKTSTTVTLTWAAVSGATGYELQWNGGAWTAATSGVVKSDLTPNTNYSWRVRATYTTPKCGADIASGNTTTNQVYHVTYAKGSGTGSCNATSSTTDDTAYEAGATVTLQSNGFTLVGHTFNEWTEDDEDITISNNQFTMPEHDVVITATWTPKVDKFYDRMHDGTDASHGGIADGDGKYYITREGCSYTVPSLTDNTSGATACHTKHYVLLGWTAEAHLNSDGTLKTGHEGYVYTGGGTQTADNNTYYAVWAEVEE